jgi:DNA-binding NarL/FixJ family response regulator
MDMEACTKNFITIVGRDEKYLTFIRNALLQSKRFTIEREFSVNLDFLSNLPALKSNIYLIESSTSEPSSLECIKEVYLFNKNYNVLLVSNDNETEIIFRAIRLGAKGYVLKTMTAKEFLAILEDISRGGNKMFYMLIQKIFEFFEDMLLISPGINFSSREKHVLSLLDAGVSCKEIAARLFLSQATVRTHIRNIKYKLKEKKDTNKMVIVSHLKHINRD